MDHPSTLTEDEIIGANTDEPRVGVTVAEHQPGSTAKFLVVSGGTGGNAICSAFDNACYVLPVSDDGGSSSEIIRVLGGPSIGDIRSRLIRLIPPAAPGSALDAIRHLLAYRLPPTAPEARSQWREIVEGRSPLWLGIPNDRKETIRTFLVDFESQVLKRAHKNFSFLNGSIGNFFLAAATGFFRSLPSAIFLFSSITSSQANILPIIITNHTVTIAAELESGQKLVGQCEISHPVLRREVGFDVIPSSPIDDLGETLSHNQNVLFQRDPKESYELIESRISRVFYMNAHGQEIYPSPNPDYIVGLESYDVLVYSCGSLWTSIIPCLAVPGVGRAIAQSRTLKAKILLLNSKNDRETHGYTALDYIHAIARTLGAQYAPMATTFSFSMFITHLVYLEGTAVPVDVEQITTIGVKCVGVRPDPARPPKFDARCVREAIAEIPGLLYR